MSQTGVLTADCFFGKAMTIEGLARWVRSRIERIEQAKKQLRLDWRGPCLLRALILFLWWCFLRPLRKSGVKAFEPIELGRISATMDEINAALVRLFSTAHSHGYDTRLLWSGAFRTLKAYQDELERFSTLVRHASTEWDKVMFACGSEAIEEMRAALLDQNVEYPKVAAEYNPADSSLTKAELRTHLGRVVLRS